ncbi:hypothetical protein FBU30_004367 [Linnemannia zychae]|nr:hypothetical protein FBU30_004367 [Linnemannia zychae]
MACPYGPHSTETVLPAQAPISIYGPRGSNGGLGDDGGADGDQEMEYILEEEEMGPPPVEVTLNIDIPKSSRPPTEGVPSTMVLNVNPSWHIVFIETIHQQRIRTAVRIQFCPSSSTARLVEHCAKVRRLQTIQVIGYASRRVELSRRIQGQSFLNKGGLVLHLDPASITFNEASYGFTLSLSSFEMEQLSRIRNSRPDIPLPLARQQNSAYCRRNLKEMYYDTVSKDVMITLRPSGEVFYGHSVVLESHAYFRTLIEQQNQSEPAMDRKDEEGHGEGKNMMDDAEAVVDEEGYARPLHSKQRSQQPSSDSSSSHFARGKTSRSFNGASSISQNRPRTRIMIEVNDTSPTVFRAVLHYMYMSHVPITGVFVSQGLQQQQQQQQQQSAATSTVTHEPDLSSITATSSSVNTSNNASESNSNLFDMTGLNALTEAVSIAVPVISSDGSTSATPLAGSATDNPVDAPIPIPPFNAPPVIRTIATTAAAATSSSAAATVSTVAGEFPWREVYAVATKYQLSGLIHLSKMALLSRLDVELAISELFEWAYHFAGLIPAYVSFLIEHVDAAVLGNGGTGQSLLWPYHDLCPAFDEIMMEFMHLLNERKTLSALL